MIIMIKIIIILIINGDKQNMGEPERPTNGSASLTVKRASLIDCQVFFNISPHLGYFSPTLGYFEQQWNI